MGEAIRLWINYGNKVNYKWVRSNVRFSKIASSLSPKTQGIISVYLVSFANFGTVGIMVGAIKGIDSKQGNKVASFALRLLLGATLASIIWQVLLA